MWLAVSVYQMLRGSEIVFTALLTVVFLRRRLTAWHTGGLALVVTGEVLYLTACVRAARCMNGSPSC